MDKAKLLLCQKAMGDCGTSHGKCAAPKPM
jgi:hypothetical protein